VIYKICYAMYRNTRKPVNENYKYKWPPPNVRTEDQ
jgi:hypothetical protein